MPGMVNGLVLVFCVGLAGCEVVPSRGEMWLPADELLQDLNGYARDLLVVESAVAVAHYRALMSDGELSWMLAQMDHVEHLMRLVIGSLEALDTGDAKVYLRIIDSILGGLMEHLSGLELSADELVLS